MLKQDAILISLPFFYQKEETYDGSWNLWFKNGFLKQGMSDEWVLWLNWAEISPIQPRLLTNYWYDMAGNLFSDCCLP